MREIKFRAWDKENRDFWRQHDDLDLAVGLDGTIWELSFEQYYPDMTKKDEQFVVQQYTGLKDKNGKEIYEGDIVLKDKQWNTTCIWKETHGMFVLEDRNGYGIIPLSKEVEIIGNIYQNPELL